MAKADSAMNRLDELRLQRELKENPANHGFDVITCRKLEPKAGEKLVARAIVYTQPNFGGWKLLKEGTTSCYGVVPLFQEFSKELEREMAVVSGGMRAGDFYHGREEGSLI
ncbi:hypothetical protein BU26DRAFT_557519 [Trematosphaeria pertusa]|uniref:Uncharacterized protein n=1 Tax=Trematosphaeria pertusa TaxID=390896 RepID=A0A6A6IZN3_9PLEO|nr:uncharacterized protein BU26DRAFT_557519 [Trematosphaeria pertusa]KAF2256045.1 hypothetical protein BU26DRAFT_557519 [Trematosphaeria pertusa]